MFFYVWRLYRSFAKNLNVYINFNFLLKSTSINVFTALSMSKFLARSLSIASTAISLRRSCVIDALRYVFSLLRQEKALSHDAVETPIVKTISQSRTNSENASFNGIRLRQRMLSLHCMYVTGLVKCAS